MNLDRIAIVSPYAIDVPGGVQSHVLGFAKAIARDHGLDVLILSPGARDWTETVDGSRIRYLGVGRTTGVRWNGSVAPISLDPRVARRLLAALRAFRPDVIHVHEPLAPLLSLMFTLLRTEDLAPAVATHHLHTEHSAVLGALAPLFRRRLRTSYAALISVGPDTTRVQARAIGIDESEFVEIPNAIDVVVRAAPRPVAAPPARRIVFVGRLEPRKGCAVLLEALGHLTEPAHVDIIGDGPERASYERIADALGTHTIVFHGRVSNARRDELTEEAQVLVAPALGGEAFGIVLLEAMAVGTPVVTSDIDGYSMLARHEENALVTPVGDSSAVASAIERILTDAGLRERVVDGGLATARHFSWAEQAPAVLDTYTRALASRSQASDSS